MKSLKEKRKYNVMEDQGHYYQFIKILLWHRLHLRMLLFLIKISITTILVVMQIYPRNPSFWPQNMIKIPIMPKMLSSMLKLNLNIALIPYLQEVFQNALPKSSQSLLKTQVAWLGVRQLEKELLTLALIHTLFMAQLNKETLIWCHPQKLKLTVLSLL